jgi:hypothetical protein
MKSNDGRGYHSAILHLAPSVLSGYNTCLFASEGCKKACLNTAGRGVFSNVQDARIRKTKLYFEHRLEFLDLLRNDLKLLERQAKKRGEIAACRLNGTSDLNFMFLMLEFPSIQFYDYTKSIERVKKLVELKSQGKLLNYDLTFSRSESNWTDCLTAISLGINVAVVFGGYMRETLRIGVATFLQVINGLEHDLRFLDQKGCIVGLVEKGKAKSDDSGFVLR